PDLVILPGVVPGRLGVPGEVEAPEEQRALGQLPKLLGLAAQPVAEHLGVGAGRGGVLTDDHLFPRAVDHGLQRRPARVVVGAFPGQGITEYGVGAWHPSTIMQLSNVFNLVAMRDQARCGSPASSCAKADRATATASGQSASALRPAVMWRQFSCA